MKRLVAVSSLFAFALTAFAQSSGDQKVVIPASKEAQTQRSYMSPGDFARYKGSYELSNGKTLYLTRKATRMYAQVDEQTQHEITGSSSGKFQALNGNMAMHLVFGADDSVSGELYYIDETQKSVAGLPLQTTHVRFASR
ncbi:hypothetical protein GTP41_12585 [Pseudoduganella sp. DS3]|uniref:Uncharacterized protein n=1 Tax=Pseudoduganella guangdongensis TaxID=2692179 RepID=A0A6N9HH56_9BURK|nr:hypothetical protein [Pseudoduganella guangdongensis]MYN02938.1 hypothetical protein [Pseudoduganella guangdongensis]